MAIIECLRCVGGVCINTGTIPSKTLRETMDKLKEKLKSAVIVLGAVGDGKVALIAGVTADLTGRVIVGGDVPAGQGGGLLWQDAGLRAERAVEVLLLKVAELGQDPPAAIQLLHEAGAWRLIGMLFECPRAGWHEQVAALGAPLRAIKDTVDALREFYAVGGTRNVLLDALLVLAEILPIDYQRQGNIFFR